MMQSPSASGGLILAGIVILLSPSAIAGVVDIAESSPDASYLEPVGIGAIVIAIVGAVIKVVPQVVALVTKATALLDRIEKKLDEDAKRNADLFNKLLLEAAERAHESPDRQP